MPHTQRSPVLRYLRRVLGTPAPGEANDSDLLTRFVTSRDESAFELLLWRHGRMVLGVCRDVTRDEHTAEDAFQATFLALVRKAAAIKDRQSLGAWLYQVAYRVALRARAQAVRRASRERYDLDLANLVATAKLQDESVLRELRPLLHDELQRLPTKYRIPIVLCYLEGLTHDEAARHLGWPRGTVAGRLSRARDLLRRRLSRRGVTMSATLAAFAFGPASALAIVPGSLMQTTLRTGLLIATGKAVSQTIPARVAALTQGVLQAMFLNRLKLTAMTVLALCLVGSVGLFASRRLIAQPPGQETLALAGPDAVDGQPEPVDSTPPKSVADPKALAEARKQSILNLSQIAQAMHSYHDVYGSFPPPAIYSQDGKPLLSWRVAILPYLGQGDLYRKFHLDEAWDSPHNKKLLATQLKVYHIPGSEEWANTNYQVFVGQDTVFEGRRSVGEGGVSMGSGAPAPTGAGAPGRASTAGGAGASGAKGAGDASVPVPVGIRRVQDIPDGTSNTILVVEAGSPVPWTKPEDLAYAATGKIPALGGAFVLADGRAFALKRKYDEQALRLAITRSDGRNFDLDKLIDPAPGMDSQLLKEGNERLRREVEEARAGVQSLQEQLLKQWLAVRGEGREDTGIDRLKEERRLLQQELERAHDEAKRLRDRIRRLQRGESEVETKKG